MEALEDRRLLTANLNLLGSGLMIYGGSGVDNDLDISFDGVNYTFADPAEPINAIGGLAGLDTNPNPNIVTFDPTLIGGAFTQVVVNHNAGDDTTTVTNYRDGLLGGEGLDIRDDAGEGNDTVNINGDIGSAANPVTASVLIRGENLNVGADIFTDNQTIAFSDDVDLTANVEIDSGTGTTQFDGAVDGAFALDIANAGSATFGGDLGTVMPLVSLSVTGNVTQTAGNVTTTGDASFTAATEIFLGGDVLAGGGGAGSVDITSPVTTFTDPGATQLSSSLAAADFVSISGDVASGAATDLTISAGLGPVSIGGGTAGLGVFNIASSDTADLDGVVGAEDIEVNATTSLNAEGFQASAGDVDINAPATTFDGLLVTLVNATGTIDFSGTITGNGDALLFRVATDLSIGGDVTGVGLFSAVRGGGLLFNSVSLQSVTADEIVIAADNSTIILNGDLVSAGDVTLIGRVEVNADVTILSGGGAGDDILIFGNVRDPAVGTRTLILDAGAGAVQNLGNPPDVGIGNVQAFLNVRVSGGIVVLDEVTVANDIILEGGTLDLNGNLSGLGDMIFRPRLPGGTLNIVNGPIAVPIPDMSVSGDDLALVQPGFTNIIFGGPTAGVVILFPDNNPNPITGAFNTQANTRFEAPLVDIRETINQGTDSLLFVLDTFEVNGTFVGTGDVNIEDFGAVGTVDINGSLNQPVSSLAAGSNNLNVNAPGSTVMFNGSIGHRIINLNVDALSVSFPATTAIDVTGNVATTGNVNVNGGIFSATGSVFIGGDMTLLGNTTLKIPGGQDFEVAGQVFGGGNNLVIRGSGGAIANVIFNDDVSGLGTFKIDSSGANTAVNVELGNVTAGDIVVRGVDIRTGGDLMATTGNVHLLGNVHVTDNVTYATGGAANRSVRVDGAVDSSGVVAWSLDVDAGLGTAVFTGTIGGGSPLNNMTVISGGVNYVTVAITVFNSFSWTIGTAGNGINDRLIRAGAGSVTAGNMIDLEADVVQGETIGVNLIAPTVNVTERGAGD